MELRASVQWFAERMEEKLRVYDDDKPGWSHDYSYDLFGHLNSEVDELKQVLDKADVTNIIIECADVANLAMMIADNHNPIKRGERE